MERKLIIIGTIACIISIWVLANKYDSYPYLEDCANNKVHNILKKKFNNKDVVVTGKKFRTIAQKTFHFTLDGQYEGISYTRYSNEPRESALNSVFLRAMSSTPKSYYFNYKISFSDEKLDSVANIDKRPLYSISNIPWEIYVYYLHQPIKDYSSEPHVYANQWDEFTIVPYLVGFRDTSYKSFRDEHPNLWFTNDSIKSQLEIHVYEALDSAYNYLTTNKESPFSGFFDNSFPYKEIYDKYNNKSCGRNNKISEDGVTFWCDYDSVAFSRTQWFYTSRLLYNSEPVNRKGLVLNDHLSKYGEGAPIIGNWNNGDFIVFFKCIPHIKDTSAILVDKSTPTALAIIATLFLIILAGVLLTQGRLFNKQIKLTGSWMTNNRWIIVLAILFVLLLIFINWPEQNAIDKHSFSVPPLSESNENSNVFFFQMRPDLTTGAENYEQSVGIPDEYVENPNYIYSIVVQEK